MTETVTPSLTDHPDSERAARRYPSLSEKPAPSVPVEDIVVSTDSPEVKQAKLLRRRYPSHKR